MSHLLQSCIVIAESRDIRSRNTLVAVESYANSSKTREIRADTSINTKWLLLQCAILSVTHLHIEKHATSRIRLTAHIRVLSLPWNGREFQRYFSVHRFSSQKYFMPTHRQQAIYLGNHCHPIQNKRSMLARLCNHLQLEIHIDLKQVKMCGLT